MCEVFAEGLDVLRSLSEEKAKEKPKVPTNHQSLDDIFGDEHALFQELLSINFATVLYRHSIRYATTPPPFLRQSLDKLLSLHPALPQLLAMYVESERRSRINGRVRTLFDKICSKYVVICLQFSTFLHQVRIQHALVPCCQVQHARRRPLHAKHDGKGPLRPTAYPSFSNPLEGVHSIWKQEESRKSQRYLLSGSAGLPLEQRGVDDLLKWAERYLAPVYFGLIIS